MNVILPVVFVSVTVGTVVVPVIVVLPLFVTVNAFAAKFPPTETVPPVPPFRVKLLEPPAMFPENVIAAPDADVPPFVASMTEFPVKAAAPVNEIALPAVVILLPILIVPAVTESPVRAAVPPTAPLKAVVPVPPAIVRGNAPLMVLLNDTFALFEVMVLVPVKVTALGNVSGLAPVTVMLFLI